MAHPSFDPTPHLRHLRWQRDPGVERPIVIAAFGGWNDAGDAATTAVRHLGEQWGAEPFADIDPEDFYDFTVTRPHVRFDDDDGRVVDWPANEFRAAHVRPGLDIVTLIGTEPQLKWRTFTEQLTGLATHLDARLVVTLGALLAEVPHTRPVSVYGAAYDDDVMRELDLMPSHYEGPTGIVGALHAAWHDGGLRSASLWAAVPTYVPGAPSPKAALALIERASVLLEADTTTADLEDRAAEYVRQIDELVADDEETAEYVASLEAAYDDSDDLRGDTSSLIAEVEKFLRGESSA